VIETDITARAAIFAPMKMTPVAPPAHPAPPAGPFDWTCAPYGADSFVFRPEITEASGTFATS
jgi:hypothetical protein